MPCSNAWSPRRGRRHPVPTQSLARPAPASAQLLDGSTSSPLTVRHTRATPAEPNRYFHRVQSITVRDLDC
jgi:hypothetical protein